MAYWDREELRRRLEISEQKRALLQKRLAVEHSDDDSTLWSFVDLLSLLLILFILFYSHAITDKFAAAKVEIRQLDKAVETPLSDKEIDASLAAKANPHQKHEPETGHTEPVLKGLSNRDAGLRDLQQQLLQIVPNEDKDELSMRWNQRRLIVTMGEKIMFQAGMAGLLSESEPALEKIAEFIAPQIGYRVLVAGHTDDTPIKTPQFPSNWELSTARAVNVAKFLITNGIAPERISVEGYSSYRPLLANNSPRNKQANRRVEITLFKDHNSNMGVSDDLTEDIFSSP